MQWTIGYQVGQDKKKSTWNSQIACSLTVPGPGDHISNFTNECEKSNCDENENCIQSNRRWLDIRKLWSRIALDEWENRKQFQLYSIDCIDCHKVFTLFSFVSAHNKLLSDSDTMFVFIFGLFKSLQALPNTIAIWTE